jgi:hypothetical protein
MCARVVVFGEASKGAFCQLYRPRSLIELEAQLGHPPDGSAGLYLATQTMLLNHELCFWRVDEEGYSVEDYHAGAQQLAQLDLTHRGFDALGLPGVGDEAVIELIEKALRGVRPLLLLRESDLYDYLSSIRAP